MNKVPSVAAIPLNDECNPVYMQMSVIEGVRKEKITKCARKHIEPETIVISDRLSYVEGLTSAKIHHGRVVKDDGIDLLPLGGHHDQ